MPLRPEITQGYLVLLRDHLLHQVSECLEEAELVINVIWKKSK